MLFFFFSQKSLQTIPSHVDRRLTAIATELVNNGGQFVQNIKWWPICPKYQVIHQNDQYYNRILRQIRYLFYNWIKEKFK